ncbi:putative ferric-chelate reductase 1 [Coregonus clupeaformis]|uniref:putative ferric-chelate reductase 1 n=1 Tax=Coregonus clupeaformis TaxID=59861 RepID=UPI001E1C7A15|nr:putative ferric-chelate reductase 1 [Coregonus clupeaformis]
MDNSSRLMLAVVMVIAYMAMRGQTQNSTVAPNATNTANTTANVTTLTTVAPIVNTTVTALTGNISRAECGKTQLCAAVPDNCDPSVAGSCFFVSTQQSSSQTFSFQLRGVSSGYIAVGLSTDSIQGGNDTTYVCANNNGIVLFFTALLNNGNLTITNTLPVNSVKGSVNNQTIQCTFSATVPNATATKSSDTSYFISLSNGIFANGILGSPTAVLFSSKRVDLGDPNTNVTNSLNNTTTTAAPSTTARPSTTAAPSSHAFVLQHTLSQALLILLGVLGMMML